MGIVIMAGIGLALWALSDKSEAHGQAPQRTPAGASPPPTQPANEVDAVIAQEEAKRKAAAAAAAAAPAAKPAAPTGINSLQRVTPPKSTPPITSTPPFSGPDQVQWAKYWTLSVLAPQTRVEPDGRLGVFLLSPRTLADQGYMRDVKRRADGSGLTGVWVAPYSESALLGSRDEQQRVFDKQAATHAAAIRSRYASYIGQAPMNAAASLNGGTALPTITLSGLMGVARHAGLGGLEKWLKATDRKAATTAIYRKFNGLF